MHKPHQWYVDDIIVHMIWYKLFSLKRPNICLKIRKKCEVYPNKIYKVEQNCFILMLNAAFLSFSFHISSHTSPLSLVYDSA